MKLILCRECRDVVKLRRMVWRACACGKASGRYLLDGLHAEIMGPCVALGIANTEIHDAVDRPLPAAPYEEDYLWWRINPDWKDSHVRRVE